MATTRGSLCTNGTFHPRMYPGVACVSVTYIHSTLLTFNLYFQFDGNICSSFCMIMYFAAIFPVN